MQSSDSEQYFDARDEADRQAQIAEEAIPQARVREGSDPEQVVTVRVGPDGLISEIHLAMDWQDQVDAEAIAPAIMSAIASIAAANATEWTQRLGQAQQMPAPATRPLPQWIADEVQAIPANEPVSADSVLAQLSELLDQLDTQLDAAIADGERVLDQTETGRSARGEVEVVVGANGSIQHLSLDPRWLERSHPTNVGRLVLETLRGAQRRSAVAFADFKRQAESTTEEMRKYQDSRYLFNKLGLS